MVAFEWYQFIETYQIIADYVPENTHFFFDDGAGTLYIFYMAGAQTTLLKTVNDGDDWSIVWFSSLFDMLKIGFPTVDWANGFIYLGFTDDQPVTNEVTVFYKVRLSDGDANVILTENDDTARIVDSFLLGANNYEMLTIEAGGDAFIDIYQNGGVTEVHQNMGAIGVRTYELGPVCEVGTDAYMLWKWSDENVELWKFDSTGPTLTEMEDCGANTEFPDSVNQYAIAYDGVNILHFVLKDTGDGKMYKYNYVISTDTLTKQSEFNVALMMNREANGAAGSPWEYEKAFHLTESYIYQIHRSFTHLLKLQDIELTGGETITAISNKYLLTSNRDVYKLTESISNFKKSSGTLRSWGVPVGNFSHRSEKSPDQIIEVFENDAGTYTLAFRGKLGRPEYDSQIRVFNYECQNFGFDDLDEKISYAAAAEGADEVVLALIGQLTNPYIYADAASVPNIAININYTFDDVKLRDALYVICILTNGYFWVEPDGYLYFRIYTNPPASGDAYTYAAKNMSVPALNILQAQHNDFSNVRGGWNIATDSEFVPTNPFIEEHILHYGKLLWRGRKSFVGAKSQAQLDAIITALKIWEGMITNPYEISFYAKDKYYYPVGSHCTLTFSQIDALDFAAPEDFNIIQSVIDFQRIGAVYITVSNNITRRESK